MSRNRKPLNQSIRILLYSGNQKIFEKLFDSYPIVIGRSPKCDIPLPQFDFISRQHAVVTVDDGVLKVVDLSSSNGLYVAGQKLKSAPVHPDFEFNIGTVRIRFENDLIEDSNTPTSFEKTIASQQTPILQNENLLLQDAEEQEDLLQDEISDVSKQDPAVIFGPPKLDKSPSQNLQQAVVPNKPPRNLTGASKKPETPQSKYPIVPKAAEPQAKTSKPSTNGALPPLPELSSFSKDPSPTSEKNRPGFGSLRASTDQMEISGHLNLQPHPLAGRLSPKQRVLEGYVTWKDIVYDVSQFQAGTKVSVGSDKGCGLKLPTIKTSVDFAFYDGQTTKCFIPDGLTASINRDGKIISMEDLLSSKMAARKVGGFILSMEKEDLCTLDVSKDIKLHFRYAPAPRALSKKEMMEPDDQIQRTILLSGIAHVFIIALAFLLSTDKQIPKISEPPQRFARLIVEKPKPIVKIEPPKPKPKPPEPIARKKPEPPKQRRPRPVVLKPTPRLKEVNKLPTKVVQQVPTKETTTKPTPDVKTVGALAALTALSTSAPVSNQPVAVNINPNAGGQSSPKIGGAIGTLKTNSGKLAAGGTGQVKTKGLGVGTGTGMGIQGIKGTAGQRAVAGAVVGSPRLAQVRPTDGLTQKQIEEVLKKYISAIQRCYERSLLGNPNLAGTLEMEWNITPAGAVSSATVKRTDMSGADAVNSCVRNVFLDMNFPQAKNGQPTIATKAFKLGR